MVWLSDGLYRAVDLIGVALTVALISGFVRYNELVRID